jgi:hypothetical protein
LKHDVNVASKSNKEKNLSRIRNTACSDRQLANIIFRQKNCKGVCLGSDKILKQKKTPGGTATPGEVLSRVGDHPPGDGVQEEAHGSPRP